MAFSTTLRLLPDELLDRLMAEIVESFLSRLNKHRVKQVRPELLTLVVSRNNITDVVGSAMSDLPEDRRQRFDMFKKIGYTISKKTESLVYGYFLISEMWVRSSPEDEITQEEGLMVRAITTDGRQRATGIYLTRDIDNCYIAGGVVNLDEDGYVARDIEWLSGLFAGVKQYIEEMESSGELRSDSDAIKSARQQIYDQIKRKSKPDAEPRDTILSKPPKINFSDN